jgi:hypothetical protein
VGKIYFLISYGAGSFCPFSYYLRGFYEPECIIIEKTLELNPKVWYTKIDIVCSLKLTGGKYGKEI